jgi:L-lactate dehydrogenase (cytochrome)
MLLHFDWMTDVMLGPKLTLGNLDPEKKKRLVEVGKLMATQINPGVTWKDVDWMRSVWNGPLILKGILTPEDARLAVQHGADAISVSNHGGRKLDGSPSSISALPAIVDEVGDRTTVLMDGGVRRGHDVVKALALGAKACLIGRAFAYGLGAMGGAGVEKAIRILEAEMREVMRGLGRSSIAELDRDCLMEVPFDRSSPPTQTDRTAADHEVEKVAVEKS